MDDQFLLSALEESARQLAIEIRYENVENQGALCRIQGKKILIVSDYLPLKMKVKIVAEQLALLETDHIYLIPQIRELLNQYQKDEFI